jgi:uncharacterized membrane protein
MGKGLQDNLRVVLSRAVEEAARNVGTGRGSSPVGRRSDGGGPLSGARGVLVGAGAAALAPVAVKGVGKLAKGAALNGLGDVASAPAKAVGKLGSNVGGAIGDKVSEKVEQAGGASGILKDAAKSALPFGGEDDKKGATKGGVPGVGKGRRMPVQQSVDIGVPLEAVYNQWTQFELWPNFMHRVTRVTQEDECTVSFETKIWGKSKEFTAKVETQRPDERVKWRVADGLTHTGVVTFHELAPRLTRVELGFDVEPGGLLEKAARGMRHIKRAARADLHRFKAFIEMQERETGAWRGVIEGGEVVEQHDPSYDKQREYFDDGESESGRKSRSGSRKRATPRGDAGRSKQGQRASSSRSQGSRSRARGSSRSSSARSSSNSSGRSGSSSSRSRASTRSRSQASRPNGRG